MAEKIWLIFSEGPHPEGVAAAMKPSLRPQGAQVFAPCSARENRRENET